MSFVDHDAVGGEVKDVAARPDGHPHHVVDLDRRGHVGTVEEELREVDVDVARALRHPAAAFDADDDQEASGGSVCWGKMGGAGRVGLAMLYLR